MIFFVSLLFSKEIWEMKNYQNLSFKKLIIIKFVFVQPNYLLKFD